jgi:UV DNA damage endonuclease
MARAKVDPAPPPPIPTWPGIHQQDANNRLGFAVKVLGRPGLKSNDSRRWQSGPHLRFSIEYLHAIFDYLDAADIRMYRISSDIAPYVTHPDMPQFHDQIAECEEELADLGATAGGFDLRLSMHPSQYIVLNSPESRIAEAAVRDFVYHAAFLDGLGVSDDAKIVTHVGGVYGDRPAAMRRWIDAYRTLPEAVRRRLVLENDDVSYPVRDILAIHAETGVPLVFDNLHHAVLNPARMPEAEALHHCLATWPADQMPKIHYSSQRTADREVVRTHRVTGARTASFQAPKSGQHEDDIHAAEFLAFLAAARDLRFDVMLEAKNKDLALFSLRDAIAAAGQEQRIW